MKKTAVTCSVYGTEMYENIKHDFAKRLENADGEEVMVDMHRAAGLLRRE